MTKLIITAVMSLFTVVAIAGSKSNIQGPQSLLGKFDSKSSFKRVGGNYSVREIKKKKNSTVITFEAEVKNGRADYIVLEADHVHVGVREGQNLRISAEVEWKSGGDSVKVKATQVLLFLPKKGGAVPVWLLSKKGRSNDLRGSSYLKMHNPQSDFVIL